MGNKLREEKDTAKETLAERLCEMVNTIMDDEGEMMRGHNRLCQKEEVWQWIHDIAGRELNYVKNKR